MNRTFTVLLVLAGIFVILVGAMQLRGKWNTAYSAEWNEASFAKIRIGDSVDEVWNSLGTPVDIVVCEPNTISVRPQQPWTFSNLNNLVTGNATVAVFQYSRPRNSHGETFRNVRIELRGGNVIGKTDGLYHEFW